jgi:hypothetical protein
MAFATSLYRSGLALRDAAISGSGWRLSARKNREVLLCAVLVSQIIVGWIAVHYVDWCSHQLRSRMSGVKGGMRRLWSRFEPLCCGCEPYSIPEEPCTREFHLS